MTCGETMDAPARRGETMVAYCIAQCKCHDEKTNWNAITAAFRSIGFSEANDDFREGDCS